MTLFELVYACRLCGKDPAYDELRKDLGQNPDLTCDEQQQSLLVFLNKWGCRIPKTQFPTLKSRLTHWAEEWATLLPAFGNTVSGIMDTQADSIANSFDALLTSHFQETCVAKTLHAVRPRSLPMWDRGIKDWFLTIRPSAQSSTGQIYAAFIRYVAEEELKSLENDANMFNVSDIPQLVGRTQGCDHHGQRRLELTDIPQLVEQPDYSLVKLVDEYYWMTITEGYNVPTRAELKQWLCWSSARHQSVTQV